ncbi:uncharacterized protein AB9W97_016630 isoform 2-T2 [Spinachia spinachia]
MITRTLASEEQHTATYQQRKTHLKHLKMMRLVFLGLLLMLPAATAVSEDTEGSADNGLSDDEDLYTTQSIAVNRGVESPGEVAGVKDAADHLTMIIIIVAVAAVILSGVVIITVLLVRRRLHNRQQGIYFVPTEQDKKEAI